MTYYSKYKNYVYFLDVSNFPSSHWSITSGWEWAKYLAQVEKDDLKENTANNILFSLYLDKVTTIDNTSWVCMSIYMVMVILGIHIYLGFKK